MQPYNWGHQLKMVSSYHKVKFLIALVNWSDVSYLRVRLASYILDIYNALPVNACEFGLMIEHVASYSYVAYGYIVLGSCD